MFAAIASDLRSYPTGHACFPSRVIRATLLLRASIAARQAAATRIVADPSVRAIDDVAPLGEVFRLQRLDELEAAGRKSAASESTPDKLLTFASGAEPPGDACLRHRLQPPRACGVERQG
jgi:hypothetical protein